MPGFDYDGLMVECPLLPAPLLVVENNPNGQYPCVDVDNVWQPPSELHTEVGQPKLTHPPKLGHVSLK